MIRSPVRNAVMKAVGAQRREASVLAYATGFGAINAGNLLASPVGSLLATALSYNIGVVGNHHISYTMDLFYKDYIQDPVLYTVMKQLTVFCLVLLIGQVFIEV
eukprot:TRINITY_DN5334_c0_g1_i1.p1 TRINITY_DN5334_c0_g1~~TRINITY_DN5334_c0_g1_i1.p1  ORF type:complete len:104 (+),score=29.40 TRINITY_DN5334_c0_g1_i1:58-369(+)